MTRQSRIVLDVTSFISAENFILSQNGGARPLDPFARQCYAEVVQSLIFFDRVAVPHPTKLTPGRADYGAQPRLLQLLFDLGIVTPLTFSDTEADTLRNVEDGLLNTLEVRGVRVLQSFIEKTSICDDEQRAQGAVRPMLHKIVDWSNFQDGTVWKAGDSHQVRVNTPDGVEDDPFGDWARRSTRLLEGDLQRLLPARHAQLHLTATLARSLRYGARANIKQLAYQAHPLRRDFGVTFGLADGGASDLEILEVIREIRGIHRGLEAAGGLRHRNRLRLLELELPLLGGRLWNSRELGRRDDEHWLQLICGRLNEYRDRASKLRQALSRCIFEEDKLRLKLDLDQVRERLLVDLGLKSAELNETERELIRDVATVADAAIGVPVVRPLLMGGRIFGKKLATTNSPYQKFVYREFIGAWRRGFD